MFVGLGSVFTSSPRRRGLNPPAVDLDLPAWQEAACKAGQTWLWPLNHQHWIPIMLRSASSAPTAAPPVIRLSSSCSLQTPPPSSLMAGALPTGGRSTSGEFRARWSCPWTSIALSTRRDSSWGSSAYNAHRAKDNGRLQHIREDNWLAAVCRLARKRTHPGRRQFDATPLRWDCSPSRPKRQIRKRLLPDSCWSLQQEQSPGPPPRDSSP